MTRSTQTSTDPGIHFCYERKLPVLLVVHTPEDGTVSVDRCEVSRSYVVGRDATSDLVVADKRMSGSHFRITQRDKFSIIADLNSKNGTFVNGSRVESKVRLDSAALIRAGQTLFVFHADGAGFFRTPPVKNYQMAGSFHTAQIISALREAAFSRRNILVCGPTGTGKELAASAIAEMLGKRLFIFNAARMASKEEAASTLFGVTSRFFSNVDGRQGVVDDAEGSVLFIDEIHNLSGDIQRGLLRVMETGETTRMGESTPRRADVRFIMASNAVGETRGLAHDLFARLRVVNIPPLEQRRADIPDIFIDVLQKQLAQQRIAPQSVLSFFSTDYIEAMILDGFAEDNIRGLVDLADRVATRIAAGFSPLRAVAEVFVDRFGGGLVATRKTSSRGVSRSRYEQNRSAIIATYQTCDGNISETVKELKLMGLRCSRRWVSIFLDKWGVR